jgi:hypothetical protein
MHITKRCSRAVAILVVAALAACSDAPTATRLTPSKSLQKTPDGAIRKLEECDPYAFSCDGGGGGGSVTPPVDNRIYLHAFVVENCDPSTDPVCSPSCTATVWTSTCHHQQFDNAYYEIRQNLYEANGTWLGYNEQRWHGNAGVVDIPIYDTRMCAGSGRYLNVEIYELWNFNTVERMVSFNVYATDRNSPVVVSKGPNTYWWTRIQYNWDAC